MENEQLGTRRSRGYQIAGLIIGAVFVALGVAAFFGGAGPIVAAIAAVGGVVVLIVSIVTLVTA